MAQLPEQIFKYVGSDRIDVLETLLIRFTQPSCFNDPFEMRLVVDGHNIEQIDEALEIVNRRMYRRLILPGEAEKLPYEKFERIQNRHNQANIARLKSDSAYRKQIAITRDFENWNSKVGILSLSAAEKNLLMWAHYADSHRGMLIGFDPRHLFFNAQNRSDAEFDFGMLTEVVYSKKRPCKHVEKTSQTEEVSMLKVKSDEWLNEQEWRVYQLLENRDKQITNGNETVYLFKLPSDCIKRVVVGRNMYYLNRKRVVNAVKANPQLKHVKIEESDLHLDLFALEYKSLAPLY